MVNSRMRVVGVLSGIILMALPFGLGGLLGDAITYNRASPTASVEPTAESTPTVSPSSKPTPGFDG